jgi:hypothetical protein
LLEAKSLTTFDDGQTFELHDIREYDGRFDELVDGIPLLTKRSVSRTGGSIQRTEEMKLVRFDSTPVDEAVFCTESLSISIPIGIPKMEERMSAKKRMHWHWAIAGCWLVVPLIVILVCKFRRAL